MLVLKIMENLSAMSAMQVEIGMESNVNGGRVVMNNIVLNQKSMMNLVMLVVLFAKHLRRAREDTACKE